MKKPIESGLTFALDFGTALLANILHAQTTMDYFTKPENESVLVESTEKLL